MRSLGTAGRFRSKRELDARENPHRLSQAGLGARGLRHERTSVRRRRCAIERDDADSVAAERLRVAAIGRGDADTAEGRACRLIDRIRRGIGRRVRPVPVVARGVARGGRVNARAAAPHDVESRAGAARGTRSGCTEHQRPDGAQLGPARGRHPAERTRFPVVPDVTSARTYPQCHRSPEITVECYAARRIVAVCIGCRQDQDSKISHGPPSRRARPHCKFSAPLRHHDPSRAAGVDTRGCGRGGRDVLRDFSGDEREPLARYAAAPSFGTPGRSTDSLDRTTGKGRRSPCIPRTDDDEENPLPAQARTKVDPGDRIVGLIEPRSRARSPEGSVRPTPGLPLLSCALVTLARCRAEVQIPALSGDHQQAPELGTCRTSAPRMHHRYARGCVIPSDEFFVTR